MTLQNHVTNNAASTPVRGTTLRVIYLDAYGAEHSAVHQTTEPASAFMQRAKEIRQAIECYYTMLGCELLSVQLMLENTTHAEDCREPVVEKRSFLRLAAVNGKRIISPDARLLAESAGLDAEAIFGEGP